MAARGGDSVSAVKKARTYISTALEFAVDEQLIARNPAHRIEVPSNRLKKAFCMAVLFCPRSVVS